MARKKRTKKVTVAELQSYIQGAIDLNDDGWHPDKNQWDNIVDMIMNVKADPPKVEKVVEQTPVQQPSHNYQQPVATGSSMTGDPAPAQGSDRRPAKLDLRESSGYKIQREGGFESQGEVDGIPLTKSGIKVKTPDVDTSVNDYDTPFT